MTAVLLGHWPVGSAEWHTARRQGLGGSEVAAALGLSPWCSPFTLWHRKRGLVGDVDESPSTYWGKALEPVICAEWTRRRNGTHDDPLDTLDVRHAGTWAADGWRIANPDRLIAADEISDPHAILEVKTADTYDAYEWGQHGSDDPAAIPIYYRVQILWYGDALGIRDLSVAVLIGGNDYREYRVPWDQAEVDDIRARAWTFWQTVVNNERPPIDGSDSTYQTVKELHPDIDGEDVEVPAEVALEYLESDLDAKAAKARAQQAKNRLLDAMGNARRALVGDQPVARRQPNGKSVSLYPLHAEEAAI